MPEPDSTVDLAAYIERIAYAGDLAPSRATLDALHLAHATHIPFENLDILLGRPIRLDLASLQAKLVRGGRGGYCFEQNRLFAAVLETLGFEVTPLAARVRFGTSAVRPRTHMLLRVDIDGIPLLADVGFGIFGLLTPVPLDQPGQSRQFAWTYRIAREAGLYVLQLRTGDAWADLYAFTLEPQYPGDYEMANHYTSTHPSSVFVQTVIAQRSTPDLKRMLRDRTYSEHRGETVTERTLADEDELLEILADEFELRFPEGTRFRPRA
ncbi:MAG TPA: arylamine N-acetyltransferase [Casimicrobiaceae bacterium]|nr:arylamine N-acetyltransferase [Casimicrobiaceae bacterium]